VRILKKYFSSISIEIYPLSESEYAGLVQEGVDGLTLYQETYDQALYDAVHMQGPKKDYSFRLNAPERAAAAGMRNMNLGVLLGLNDWRKDVFSLGAHARALQDKFPDVEFGVSVPRLRPHTGSFPVPHPVSDRDLAQIIIALRLFLPRLSISLSTREPQQLRDNLLPLGITRMSAGSTTQVGGRTIIGKECENLPQFEILDNRSVEEVKLKLAEKGYQPVMKDWVRI
jgi:2-iminoacetate synthase